MLRMLRNHAANHIINDSEHTAALDQLMCLGIKNASLIFPQLENEYRTHNFRLQFDTYTPFKGLPAEIINDLFASYLRRTERAYLISKHLPLSIEDIALRFDAESEIDVLLTLKTWLKDYLHQHLPLIGDYTIEPIVLISKLFRLALIACDLESCETLWNQVNDTSAGSTLHPHYYTNTFDHLVKNHALSVCKWFWGKADQVAKLSMLQDNFINPEREGLKERKSHFVIAVTNKDKPMIAWLISCYQEMNIAISFLTEAFQHLTATGDLEMCQWLWDHCHDEQRTNAIANLIASSYCIANILINHHLPVIVWLKQICNDDQLAMLTKVENDKKLLFSAARYKNQVEYCHAIWDSANNEERRSIFEDLSSLKPAANQTNGFKVYHHVMAYTWDDAPSDLKDKLLLSKHDFLEAFHHGALTLCRKIWAHALLQPNFNQFRTCILTNLTFGLALRRHHLDVCEWLWDKLGDDEKHVIINDTLCEAFPYDQACMHWLHRICNEMKSDKQVKLHEFRIDIDHNTFDHYADVCVWQYAQMSTAQQANQLTHFTRHSFISALAKFEFYMCDWVWRLISPEMRHRLLMSYDRHNHSNHDYLHEWLYQHAENDEQRFHLLQVEGFIPVITALSKNNLPACQHLFAVCKSQQEAIVTMATESFPKIILSGALTTAEWLWELANTKQRALILKKINIMHVNTIHALGYKETATWVAKLITAATDNMFLPRRAHSFWRPEDKNKQSPGDTSPSIHRHPERSEGSPV